tara:strand:- start:51 stop:491 length:441 start_codon:yes stop_codon:yes gene_type:complete
MSQLYVDNIRNRTGGPIGIPTGAVVTGVLTATTGNITGNMTVGGVLTYEDVTNIDSVGIITARSGIRIGAGQSIGSDGADAVFYGDGSNLTGVISGVELEFEGTSVGTAITNVNFVGFNSVTAPDSAGLSTVTGWSQFDTWLYGGG